jgi:hypothetical protein
MSGSLDLPTCIEAYVHASTIPRDLVLVLSALPIYMIDIVLHINRTS